MFSYESKFYQATCMIYKFLVLNILCGLTSCLIVTIPASVSATCKGLKNDRITGIASSYFRDLKSYFFTTIPIGIFNLFSLLTVFQLSESFLKQTLLMKILLLVVIVFVTGYNLELYINVHEKKGMNGIDFFRQVFFFTILNYHKLFLTILVFFVLSIMVYKALGLIATIFLLISPFFYLIQKMNSKIR